MTIEEKINELEKLIKFIVSKRDAMTAEEYNSFMIKSLRDFIHKYL